MSEYVESRVKPKTSFSKSAKKNINSYAMIIALLAIWILFSVLTDGIFMSFRNLSMLFRQTTIMGLLAIGMTICIISGNFDLSVGSVVGFTGVVVALAQRDFGLSAGVSILLALATGLLVGLWQGYWIAVRKIPAFIVTLGGMMIFRGLTVWASGGAGIAINSKWFAKISMEYLPVEFGWILAALTTLTLCYISLRNRQQRKVHGFSIESTGKTIVKLAMTAFVIFLFAFAMNAYKGVPIPVVILLVFLILFNFILGRTVFGRHVYAVGGNANASRLSGISIAKTTLIIFVLMGLLAAIAGIVLAARIGTATPDAGNSYEMYAIASCVIGGISLLGGRGKVLGALVGSLVIASLNNGMSLMNLAQSVQNVITGLILIAAVWFDVYNTSKIEK